MGTSAVGRSGTKDEVICVHSSLSYYLPPDTGSSSTPTLVLTLYPSSVRVPSTVPLSSRLTHLISRDQSRWWPNLPRYQLRVWVDSGPRQDSTWDDESSGTRPSLLPHHVTCSEMDVDVPNTGESTYCNRQRVLLILYTV